MLEKLRQAEIKYESILYKLSDPATTSDIKEYTALMREQKSMEPLILKYREYCAKISEASDLEQMIPGEDDPDFKKELEAELKACRECAALAQEELKILLLPKDPDDQKSVVIEIRAGAGGEEAALFASDLYRMYTMYADKRGLKTERIDWNETELGGYKEIDFLVRGEGAYSRFKYESGVHRVQRVPETEAQGRIQTSTATVAVLPEAEDVDIVINPADLIIESCKSSGAGGQHINKTESAVRITHKPSGIVVWCQEERSQMKNKDKALSLLRTKLYDIARTEADQKMSGERRSQIKTGDRSEKIRTYNYPQKRVTDHRIGLTLYTLQNVIDGDLDFIIDELTRAENADRLKNST